MIEWTPSSNERAFELYEQYFDRLQHAVAATNISLGSPHPMKTQLERLTRDQFEELCTNPSKDKETIKGWLRRIIRGHENEFSPQLLAG